MSTILHAQYIRVQRRPAIILFLVSLLLLSLSALAAGERSSGAPLSVEVAAVNSYRGYRIESAGFGLMIPELELAAADYTSLCHAANRLLFRSRSGVVDPDLERRLSAADRNGDLVLSGVERDHFLSRVPVAYRGLLAEHLDYYWGHSEDI